MKHLQSFLYTFFLISIVAFARADSSQELSLSELTQSADRIDVARCIEMSGRWQGKNIVTDNKLLVLQNIKGAAHAQQFTLKTLGGIAAHPKLKVAVKMVVPGGAGLNLDKEFLLFSKQMSDGQYQLVGFSQGLFAIETDKSNGERTIPVGYKLLTIQNDDYFHSTPDLLRSQNTQIGTRNITLEEMIERIQKLL